MENIDICAASCQGVKNVRIFDRRIFHKHSHNGEQNKYRAYIEFILAQKITGKDGFENSYHGSKDYYRIRSVAQFVLVFFCKQT